MKKNWRRILVRTFGYAVQVTGLAIVKNEVTLLSWALLMVGYAIIIIGGDLMSYYD